MPLAPKQRADSDIAARNLDTPGKYTEGSVPGVFLHVTGTAKVWRLRYRLHGVGGLFTIGKFPDIGHARACELGQEARSLIAEGIKPLDAKKARIAAQREKETWTFQRVTDLWLIYKSDKATKTQAGYRSVLNNHILPRFGSLQVERIEYTHLRDLILGLSNYPAVAKHAHIVVRSILDYAMNLGVLKENIADRRVNLVQRPKTVHHAALETPEALKEFIGRLHNTSSSTVVSALWLQMLLAVRPNELVQMRWEQLQLSETVGESEWRFTMSKTNKAHVVPLPNQAVGLLRHLRERQQENRAAQVPTPFGTRTTAAQPILSGWVLPSRQRVGRPIASISLSRQIRALGYGNSELTAHGFRTTFRTLAEDALGIDGGILEACLGHERKDTSGLKETYARGQRMVKRRDAMQRWADYVEQLWNEATEHGTLNNYTPAYDANW
ncbi:tyrosine-type recombinase/integrase [Pseudomonas putida]|uniref:tyrosine-type recombinase/integrase n=1 Tax=Pseudomonas putida TaxID=303 RepID=UPI00384DF45E